MDPSQFESYLKDRYEPQIQWYEKRSASTKKSYEIFQWGLIVLSALTPVLVVIDFVGTANFFLRCMPIVTSVLVAILSSGSKTFKFQENWMNYRTTCETMKKEIHFYKAGSGEYSQTDNKEKLFVERVESLISRENTLWLAVCNVESQHGISQAPH